MNRNPHPPPIETECSAHPNRRTADDDWPAALAFDRAHLWHPYSSMIDPPPTYAVVGAAGVRLHLADGRAVIDGMASWWAASFA